jgi:hypothetical protein
MAETSWDSARETWDYFVERSRTAADEHFARQGIAEAREIFSEDRAELADLMTRWERFIESNPNHMDRAKIVAFVAEARRLLAT